MSQSIEPFSEPLYVTRPYFPDLTEFTSHLEQVWESRWLTNSGPKHVELEAKLGAFLGSPHLSLFNNGTIALITACQSLELTGEVITTPFTFPATPHVLTWNRLQPVFCDIDPHSMNVDPAKIEGLITDKTTAILGVHVFGVPCDVVAIQEIADRHGLKVIYDAAHAFGVEVSGVPIGQFGDASMFSFHATKLFHTGEGGALCVSDRAHKGRIDLLKNFGIKNEEQVVMAGINGKMNEIQAALGLVNLPHVRSEIEKRRNLTKIYTGRLSDVDGITLAGDIEGVKRNFQYFPVRIDRDRLGISRDHLNQELRKYNVFSRKYFFPLCSEYSCYKHLSSSDRKNLPVAHKIVSQIMTLPLFGAMKSDDVHRVCDMILHISKRK